MEAFKKFKSTRNCFQYAVAVGRTSYTLWYIEHLSSLESESRSQKPRENSLADQRQKSHQSILCPVFPESPCKFVSIMESERGKLLGCTLVLRKLLATSGGKSQWYWLERLSSFSGARLSPSVENSLRILSSETKRVLMSWSVDSERTITEAGVGLTSNLWILQAVHFIDLQWRRKCFVLGTAPFGGDNYGESWNSCNWQEELYDLTTAKLWQTFTMKQLMVGYPGDVLHFTTSDYI